MMFLTLACGGKTERDFGNTATGNLEDSGSAGNTSRDAGQDVLVAEDSGIEADAEADAAPHPLQLDVRLSPTNPSPQMVPMNARNVHMLALDFTASDAGEVCLRRLHFDISGLVASGTLAELEHSIQSTGGGAAFGTLTYSGDPTDGVTWESDDGGFCIPAGATRAFNLFGDFGATGSGDSFGFDLDRDGIEVIGSASVEGSFPIQGSVFTVASVSIARLIVEQDDLYNLWLGYTTVPLIGEGPSTLMRFNVTAEGGDVEIDRATLQFGFAPGSTIQPSDLVDLNFGCMGYEAVGMEDALGPTDAMQFDVSVPILVREGETLGCTLGASILDGATGDVLRIWLDPSLGMRARDLTLGMDAQICTGPSAMGCDDTTANLDGSSPENTYEVVIARPALSVTLDGSHQDGTYPRYYQGGTLSASIFDFTFTGGEDGAVSIDELRFMFTTSNGDCGGPSLFNDGGTGTPKFANLRIIDRSTGMVVMGPVNLDHCIGDGCISDQSQVPVIFNDAWSIQSGEARELSFVADIDASAYRDVAEFCPNTEGPTYHVCFLAFLDGEVTYAGSGEDVLSGRIIQSPGDTGGIVVTPP